MLFDILYMANMSFRQSKIKNKQAKLSWLSLNGSRVCFSATLQKSTYIVNSHRLQKYIYCLSLFIKDSNTDYTIRWKIVDRGRAYSPSTKICNLCLKEKYIIICKPQMASLNSRNELKTECRHRKKHLLYKL